MPPVVLEVAQRKGNVVLTRAFVVWMSPAGTHVKWWAWLLVGLAAALLLLACLIGLLLSLRRKRLKKHKHEQAAMQLTSVKAPDREVRGTQWKGVSASHSGVVHNWQQRLRWQSLWEG